MSNSPKLIEGPGGFPAPRVPNACPASPQASYPPAVPAPGTTESDSVAYWPTLRRHAGVIVASGVLFAAAAFFFTLRQPAVYRARATVEIQPLNENFFNMKAVDPTATEQTDSYFATQAKLLESETLVEDVVRKLGLERDPEFTGPATPGQVRETAAALRHRVLAAVAANLGVHASPNTRLVEVTFDSRYPARSAEFANTLTGEFIARSVDARLQGAQRIVQWLGAQVANLKTRLEASESRLLEYANSAGLIFRDDKESSAEQQLRKAQEDLAKAQNERILWQSKYELAVSAPPDALPEVLDDVLLRGHREKLADLRRQVAELSSTYTAAYPRVERVQNQIAALESAAAAQRQNVISRIRNEFQAAKSREAMLADQFAADFKTVAQQSSRAVRYNMLKHEVDTNRQLYEATLQKLNEATMASAMRASHVRVVDPARTPLTPFKPNRVFNTGLGGLFGIVFAVALVRIRELTNRSIRHPGDTPLYLQIPELGVIPSSSLNPNHTLEYAASGPSAIVSPNVAEKTGAKVATFTPEQVAIAECFRNVLVSILLGGAAEEHPHTMVVTSPQPGDGKTMIACNLALALAEVNKRVVVVDGDLHKPRVHENFGVSNSWGLSDLLREDGCLSELPRAALVRSTSDPRVAIVPAGPAAVSVISLLCSRRMLELLVRLREEFDYVLIDAPPALGLSDARVLGRMADGVILVLRAGRASREEVLAIKQRFAEDGTLILGTILNRWDRRHGPLNGSAAYRYYSHYGPGAPRA